MKITKFFALYYDEIHRQGKSLTDLKLKILKDKIYNVISHDIYIELMQELYKIKDEKNSINQL